MSQPGFLIGSAAISQAALLLAVWKLPRLFGDVGPEGWQARVQWRPERFSLVDVLVCAVGTLSVGAIAIWLLTLASIKGGVLTGMSDVARTTGPAGFGLLLLFGAIAPGFAEELTFRGLLQSRLVTRSGVVVGILISAVLFGVWHFDVRQGLMAIPMGVWLGWCAQRQGTIVNVAIAHALNNAFAFTSSRFSLPDETGASPTTMVVVVIVSVLCGATVWRRTRQGPAPT
jgi:hypothetical protein